MRQHTEHRITQMTSEDAQEKQAKAEAEAKRLATENAALSGAGDEVVVHLAEIRRLKAELARVKADHASDLETARAALRAEAAKPAFGVCPSCGYEPAKPASRYDPNF